jgi:hypothetical protein
LQGNSDFLPESPTFTQRLFIDNFKTIEEYLLSKADEETILCNLAKYILEHVYVVFVQTDNFTSSFRLFNVLNTRGMPLAASDLIKNSLFESAENSGENYKKVEEYWEKIEDTIGVENLDKFLMINKLSQKKDRDRAVKNLVDEYTELLRDIYLDQAINFTVDLLKSAGNYQRIRDLEFEDMALFKIFSSLSRLSDEWLPPVLAFINRMDKDPHINKKPFKEFVQIFEKCYMHGWFKKQVRSKREIVCYSALVAINTGKSLQDILDVIKDHADNEGFLSSLDDDIYEPSPNRINFIKAVLLRIDQEMQDDSVYKTYHGRITIEHVLPQRNLNDYWRARFTNEEHGEWLHKLGNLTLISGTKNSEAQNSSFDKKKEIYGKNNKKVSFDITKEVCDYLEWNLSSIKKRHQVLVNMAKRIWMI